MYWQIPEDSVAALVQVVVTAVTIVATVLSWLFCPR